MSRFKVSFKNKNNDTLEGIVELPTHQKAHSFAVFAHCFTCTKNLIAISKISKALTQAGFGVLRFDFTGLGDSEGDFSDTNFSGNVADLVEAAAFLEKNYGAPSLLVGHSLGGAAVIFAANVLPSVKAVVTIGAPSDPEHVKKLIKSKEDEILKTGKARVTIEGRDFTIKKQFLEDLQNRSLERVVRNFKKALLIFHSPQDNIVGIKNAEDIYKAALHPKSFISLDGADHLMSKKEDAQYVGLVIGAWVARYIKPVATRRIESNSQIVASLNHEDGFTTYLAGSNNNNMIADEPEQFGGNNFGPTPYDYVSAGLAACTAMTLQMYAKRKKWVVDQVTVHIDHDKEHAKDCEDCEQPKSKIDTFRRGIEIQGDLSEEQKQRLMQIADRCPVHKTLTGEHVQIISHLES